MSTMLAPILCAGLFAGMTACVPEVRARDVAGSWRPNSDNGYVFSTLAITAYGTYVRYAEGCRGLMDIEFGTWLPVRNGCILLRPVDPTPPGVTGNGILDEMNWETYGNLLSHRDLRAVVCVRADGLHYSATGDAGDRSDLSDSSEDAAPLVRVPHSRRDEWTPRYISVDEWNRDWVRRDDDDDD